ncbi:MAG TPA: oligosaccharyl transferase, archaeosortase A system-associated [Candidatus Methanoperedens sp.]
MILIILVAFIIRLFTYPQVFDHGRIVFLETDPYYHMWRVFSFIDTFPGTFSFDAFINYPYGAYIGWPPLFDQTTAFISIILGLGKPDTHLVEATGAFMPVLLGIFSVISVYYIAKEIFNERIALYSSLLLAVMPAHPQISFLGFTDHHIAEVFLSVMAYLFFIKSIKNSSRKYAIISGIFIGISFLTWIGAPIFIGILLSYALIQFILDKKSGIVSDYLMTTGTISFVVAFFIMLVFYLFTPWQQNITAETLSYFQLIYLAISAVIIFLLGSVSNRMKNRKWYYYPLLIGIFTAFLILLIIPAIPSFYHSLAGGIGYLMRDVSVLRQISEAQPLFFTYDGKFLGLEWNTNPVWYSFTFSFYAAIIGLVWFFYSHRNGIDRQKLFFAVWTLIALTLALFQRRFTYTLAVNVSILSGFFIYTIVENVKSSSLKRYNVPISIVIILFFIIPNIAVTYDLSRFPPKPSEDWYDSLMWLRANTPDIPGYGIMTWWDYGNWILYISKRPVVANNFQMGGDRAAKFFVAQNETLANSIMNERKARYVILDRRMGLNKFIQGNQLVLKGTFMAVVDFADKDLGMYLDKNNLPNDNYFQTMYARLYIFDGNGLNNYRMIYESNETSLNLFDEPAKNIKIFEYVKGAKITGKALPDEIVDISGTIITNQKRRIYYTQKTKADDKGYYEVILPYSTDGPYETRILKGYEIKHDNSTNQIEVPEIDVINGNTIMVN